MNRENIDRLIAHLREIPEDEFNMGNFCGTACCIAGHAVLLARGHNNLSPGEVVREATDWLGLNWGLAYYLFNAAWDSDCEAIEDVTKGEAIQALEFVHGGADALDLAAWSPDL